MGNTVIAWYLAQWLPPLVAGLGAGLWLLRRRHRLTGAVFLAWTLVGFVTFAVNFWYCFIGQLQPGATADNWSAVVEGLYFGMRMSNALALTAFVVSVFRHRAVES